MKKSNEWWDAFMHGSFAGIFAGISIGFLMWGTPENAESKSAYTKFEEQQFEFKK